MKRFKQKYGHGDGGLENKPPSSKEKSTKQKRKASLPSIPSTSTSISVTDSKAQVPECHLDEYMDAIVKNWNGKDPRELFKVQNWKIWIRREAASKSSDEYTSSKSLSSFAKALISNLSSQPYMAQICNKLDCKGSLTFTELVRGFEDKETMKLLNAVVNSVSNDEDSSSDNDDILEPPEKSPRLGIVNPVISSSFCSPGVLFSSPLACTGVSRSHSNANFSTPSRNSSLKRRNGSLLSRKGQWDGKLSTLRGIRNTESPENVRCENDRMTEKRLNSGNLELPTRLGFDDVCSEASLRDEDVIIENPTPPVSPFTAIDDDFPDIEFNREKSRFSFETSTVEHPSISIRPQISSKLDSKLSSGNNKNQGANLRAYNNSNACNELPSPTDEAKNTSFFEHEGSPNGFELSPEINLDSHSVKSKGVPISAIQEEDFDSAVDQNKENFPINAEEILAKFPKPASAPQLTLHMFEEIRKALEKPEKDKVVSGFSLNILQEDFAIVNDEQDWLIDLHMDFYLELIKERSKQPGYQSVYIFHSFFYTLLTEGKDPGYIAVQETTGEDDIFNYDLVFFPVNRSHHWRLVVVQFSKKLIRCFDSMKHDNSEILRNIARFLKMEYRRKYKCNDNEVVSSYFDYKEWTVENVASDIIPQQKNAIDCGIFCLQYAEYLSRLQDFDFDQSHIRYFRKRMLFEFLSKKLLTS